jgi:Family of unknown function (DUF6159)
MFERISYTWQIMGASWEVLKRNKSLLIFPILSTICCLVVIASFAVPIITTHSYRLPSNQDDITQKIIYYGTIFAFYFCNYFVIAFFNTAIIACAIRLMNGEEPTVMTGFNDAFSRIHLIAAWALVAATVGMVLKIISERSGKLGRIVVSLIGGAWSIMTYMVVPVIVMQNKNPIEAVKESARLLKQTWGERLVGSFSFGAIFGLLMLPGIGLLVLGFVMFSSHNQPLVAGLCASVGVLYIVLLLLIQSAMQSIFQAAIYLHAQGSLNPNAPIGRGFPVQLIRTAMVAK